MIEMRCALCSDLDGLLFDPDLIVAHLLLSHDIHVTVAVDGETVLLDEVPT